MINFYRKDWVVCRLSKAVICVCYYEQKEMSRDLRTRKGLENDSSSIFDNGKPVDRRRLQFDRPCLRLPLRPYHSESGTLYNRTRLSDVFQR